MVSTLLLFHKKLKTVLSGGLWRMNEVTNLIVLLLLWGWVEGWGFKGFLSYGRFF